MSANELDEVPWADLEATRMPGNLRALASPDPAERERALTELGNDLYECSPELSDSTAPFLLRMLADGSAVDRAGVVDVLTQLVLMFEDGFRTAGFDLTRFTRPDPTYTAMEAGVALVAPMLAEPDEGAALSAALYVVLFPGRAATALPYLRRLCARTDVARAARTTALVTLGLLAGVVGDRSDADLLTQIAMHAPDRVRWAAGVALARTHGPDLPAVAVEAILAERVFADLNWDTYDREIRCHLQPNDPTLMIDPYLAELRDLPEETVGAAVRSFLPLAESLPPEDAETVAVTLTGIAFDGVDKERLQPRTSTGWQRAVLRLLLDGDKIWWTGEVGLYLSTRCGLPDTPDALAEWLERA